MKLRANMATSRVEAGALKERLICAAMLGALLLPSPSALPQIGPEGGVYQILCKDNFSQQNWTVLSPQLTATGNALSWSDPTLPRPPRRFYRILQVR